MNIGAGPADTLLERFVYPGRLPPHLSLAQPAHRTRSLLPPFCFAERISCAHRTPISPRSFSLHRVRALQRHVSQHLHESARCVDSYTWQPTLQSMTGC